jgi:ubiquinone/menaquinone biosynthesis C-methylase UbiE
MSNRVPLIVEPISGVEAVAQYDKGARLYILPEYKYFVWKIKQRGIRKGRVLDIGTGSGRLAFELAKARGCNFDITALDISADMLVKARTNSGHSGPSKDIKFVLGTAAALPFPDKSFDLVISYASLHHWFQPGIVLQEALRVTADKGLVIIRDNRRIYGNRFWEAFIRALSFFMNKRHRENWPKAISASYTLLEIQQILNEAHLHEYKISTDFIFFDVCLEARKR